MPDGFAHSIVLRDANGVVSWSFVDLLGDEARVLNMAWYVLGRYGAAKTYAEVYAGPEVEDGPPVWADAANLVLRIDHPAGLQFETDNIPSDPDAVPF